jgi:hypothetical protein
MYTQRQMDKIEAQKIYEAFKRLEQKKQADFYVIAYNAALKQVKESRMSFREIKAWSAFCEALPREEKKPAYTEAQLSQRLMMIY